MPTESGSVPSSKRTQLMSALRSVLRRAKHDSSRSAQRQRRGDHGVDYHYQTKLWGTSRRVCLELALSLHLTACDAAVWPVWSMGNKLSLRGRTVLPHRGSFTWSDDGQLVMRTVLQPIPVHHQNQQTQKNSSMPGPANRAVKAIQFKEVSVQSKTGSRGDSDAGAGVMKYAARPSRIEFWTRNSQKCIGFVELELSDFAPVPIQVEAGLRRCRSLRVKNCIDSSAMVSIAMNSYWVSDDDEDFDDYGDGLANEGESTRTIGEDSPTNTYVDGDVERGDLDDVEVTSDDKNSSRTDDRPKTKPSSSLQPHNNANDGRSFSLNAAFLARSSSMKSKKFIKELRAQIESLHLANAALQDRNLTLEQLVREGWLKKRIADEEEQDDAISQIEQLAALYTELRHVKEQFKEVEDERNELREGKASLELQFNNSLDDVKELRKTCDLLRQKHSKVIREVSDEFTAASQKHEQNCAALRASRDEALQQNVFLQQDLLASRQEYDSLLMKINDWMRHNNSYENGFRAPPSSLDEDYKYGDIDEVDESKFPEKNDHLTLASQLEELRARFDLVDNHRESSSLY